MYVSVQGSRLTKVGERLVIRNKNGKILEDVPLFRLKQVVCFGTVEITNAAIIQLLRREIDVVYMTVGGRFKGRLSNFNESSVKCRMKQYQMALDEGFRLKVAKAILRGKLLNSKYWVMKRNRPASEVVSGKVWQITSCIDMIESAADTGALMGIEGTAAKAYFQGMRYVCKQDLGFTDRNRRPPKDPINAMLSFGYTLLYNMVLAAIEQAGLDPMLSNLHAIQDRRASLVLDIMEEFRSPVVDTVVMRMVNLMRVQPKNFYNAGTKGTRMEPQTIALLVTEIQSRLRAKLPDPVTRKMYKIKDLFLKQAYQYKALILGERDDYLPVLVR